MAAPFTPPDHFQKPDIPSWVPPPKPTENLDYAKLHTIELALVDSPDPAVRAQLIEIAKEAIRVDGFLYLTNYGVSLEQVCISSINMTLSLITSCTASSVSPTSCTEISRKKTRIDCIGIRKEVCMPGTSPLSVGEQVLTSLQNLHR